MTLPTTGEVSYNGVEFDVLFTSKITGTPEYDDSGRVVKWIRWTLTVEGYISADDVDVLDDSMEDIRQRLTAPAQELKFEDKGFGLLHVNGVSRIRDVNWGPKPEMLSWTPMGGDQSCHLVWRISTCIPECDNARYKGIVALNHEVSLDADQDGYTTRTITGHIEIALTRHNDGPRIKETAFDYRDKIVPVLPHGYKRETQSLRLSQDRRRLDFTFVDKELPAPLPSGTTQCEFDHSVGSELAKGFAIWKCRLSGTVTLAAGMDKIDAFSKFALIYNSRLSRARRIARRGFAVTGIKIVNGAKKDNIIGHAPSVIVDRVEYSEQIFGRQSRFSVDYRLMGVPLTEIVRVSGLWEPIDGTSWARYRDSDGSLYQTLGEGTGQVPRPKASDDFLIDLCHRPTPSIIRGEWIRNPEPREDPDRNNAKARDRNVLGDRVEEDSSWLFWKNALQLLEGDRVVLHRRLPSVNPDKFDREDAPDAAGGVKLIALLRDTDGAPKPPAGPAERDVIQKLGAPTYRIVMEGGAQRLGHKVAVPRLVRVGGQDVRQVGRDVVEDVMGAAAGVRIHRARWRITYVLADAPRGPLPDLSNPVLGTDGGKVK